MAYKYGWWSYAKWMIRQYPFYKEEREDLRTMRITAGFSTMPGSSEVSRGTEVTAMKVLPGSSEREFQAVDKAISTTAKKINGAERLAVIDLVFWKQSHTLVGAALVCHVSPRTARRYHTDFIKLVAKCYGLLDE